MFLSRKEHFIKEALHSKDYNIIVLGLKKEKPWTLLKTWLYETWAYVHSSIFLYLLMYLCIPKVPPQVPKNYFYPGIQKCLQDWDWDCICQGYISKNTQESTNQKRKGSQLSEFGSGGLGKHQRVRTVQMTTWHRHGMSDIGPQLSSMGVKIFFLKTSQKDTWNTKRVVTNIACLTKNSRDKRYCSHFNRMTVEWLRTSGRNMRDSTSSKQNKLRRKRPMPLGNRTLFVAALTDS
jgi:hypothetical protein